MKNKIQWSVFGAILLISSTSHAFWCGYKDRFRVEGERPGLFITHASADQGLGLRVMNGTDFEIIDLDCKPGFVHLIVARSHDSWCRLDIEDGPYFFDPIVKAECSNLAYKKLKDNGFEFFAHAYTLSFQ